MTYASRKGIHSLQFFAALLAFAVPAVRAAGTSALVDTGFVAEAIKRHAIIWDTRSAAAYKQGHIPGAVNIDDVGTVLREENTEDYIAHEEIEKLLGGAGIDPAKEVIVYGVSKRMTSSRPGLPLRRSLQARSGDSSRRPGELVGSDPRLLPFGAMCWALSTAT